MTAHKDPVIDEITAHLKKRGIIGTPNSLAGCPQCDVPLIERKTVIYCTNCGCEWKKAPNR